MRWAGLAPQPDTPLPTLAGPVLLLRRWGFAGKNGQQAQGQGPGLHTLGVTQLCRELENIIVCVVLIVTVPCQP